MHKDVHVEFFFWQKITISYQVFFSWKLKKHILTGDILELSGELFKFLDVLYLLEMDFFKTFASKGFLWNFLPSFFGTIY